MTLNNITINGELRQYLLYIPQNFTSPIDVMFYFHAAGSSPFIELPTTDFLIHADSHNLMIIAPLARVVQCKNLTAYGYTIYPCYDLDMGKTWEVAHIANGIWLLGDEYAGKSRCASSDIDMVNVLLEMIEMNYTTNIITVSGAQYGGAFAYYCTQCIPNTFTNLISWNGGIVVGDVDYIQAVSTEAYDRMSEVPYLLDALKTCAFYVPIEPSKGINALIFASMNESGINGIDTWEWSEDMFELFSLKEWNFDSSFLMGVTPEWEARLTPNILTYMKGNYSIFKEQTMNLTLAVVNGKYPLQPLDFAVCIEVAFYSSIGIITFTIVIIIVLIVLLIAALILTIFCCIACCQKCNKNRKGGNESHSDSDQEMNKLDNEIQDNKKLLKRLSKDKDLDEERDDGDEEAKKSTSEEEEEEDKEDKEDKSNSGSDSDDKKEQEEEELIKNDTDTESD